MKKVGLHIRLENRISEVIEKADNLNLPTFQSFLVNNSGKYIKLTEEDARNFVKLRKKYNNIFLHSSFWINLASNKSYNLRLIKKELDLAKELKFTHIIIHPGSAKEHESKEHGIDLLTKRLNKILKEEKDITILLENTAHGKATIGNDILDFEKIQNKVDHQLKYCLDTAHAYAYGYDIKKPTGLEDFLNLIESTMGIENIELIHLNDTTESLGSKNDRHTVPGEGKLGIKTLKNILEHPKLKKIDAVLELPPKASDEQEIKAVNIFNQD